MKVALVNNNYALGGGETVARQLLDGLPKHGISADLWISDFKRLPNHPRVMALDSRFWARVRRTRFNAFSERLVPQYAQTNRSFRRLAQRGYDLINIHNFHGIYASVESLAQLAVQAPVVWTFHRFWGVTGGCDHPFDCRKYMTGCGGCPQLGSWPLGWHDNTAEEHEHKLETIASAPLHIVSPSDHLAHTVHESPIGHEWPVTVIRNGVDPGRFRADRKEDPKLRERLGLRAGIPVVLFANRAMKDPDKGWPQVAAAVHRCAALRFQLVLVGHGTAWAGAQLESNIDWIDLGYISDRIRMAELLEATDCFLYGSSGENYPCITLEAMSAGCCVVSTPCLGVTEQIRHGETGFLSERNDGASLGETLARVLALPRGHRARIGLQARDWVQTHASEEAMLKGYAELFNRITRVGLGATLFAGHVDGSDGDAVRSRLGKV